jgi:hypothetical protein
MHSHVAPYKADANNIGAGINAAYMQKMHSHVMSHRNQRISRKGAVMSRYIKADAINSALSSCRKQLTQKRYSNVTR